MKYLGHLLNSYRLDPHIENIKQDFVIKVNSFLGDFTNVSAAVKFDLFQSYCMSFYGSNICDLGNIECMYTEWRKAIRRIWNVPYRTHSNLLCHISRCVPPDVSMQQRFTNFFMLG